MLSHDTLFMKDKGLFRGIDIMTDIETLEEQIYLFQHENDSKKKHIFYLNLVEESLKLVNKIVSTVYPIPISVSRDDLVQVGAIGVLNAIKTYEVKEKGSFKTYASKFIRGKILQYLRDKANLVKPPRETSENINVVKNYIDNLNSDNIPDAKEISKALNIPVNKVQDILNAELLKNIVSLDQKVYSADGIETLADRILTDNEKNYENDYENKKVLEFAMNKLPDNEKIAILKYYIEGETKKNIAKELNVSQTQVARLIKRALNKMYEIITNDMNYMEGK